MDTLKRILIGQCAECAEHTDVNEPCCNAPVWFEGNLILITEIELERE
jgi:hypothetical protein